MRLGQSNAAVDTGYLKLIPIKRGFQCNPIGNETLVPFDGVGPMVDGREASVLELIAVLPQFNVAFPATNEKRFLDGVSISQLVARHTLAAADNSPFAQAGVRGKIIVNAMDGYRSSYLHGFFTGRPQFFSMGADVRIPLVAMTAGNSVLNAQDFGDALTANIAFHTEIGGDDSYPPQLLGPYGEFDDIGGGGATWTDTICMRHRFVRARGNREDWGFPLRELVGAPLGDVGQGGAGYWAITLGGVNGNTIDDAFAVTFESNSPVIDVWAIVYVHGANEYPCPPTAVYTTAKADNDIIRLPAGPMMYAGFLKQLVNGAMQTHGETDVALLQDGKQIQYNILADLYQKFFPGAVKRASWVPTRDETVITGSRQAARLSRNGNPLVMTDGSILRAPGSPDGLQFQINVSSEASEQVCTVSLTPTTSRMRNNAAAWGKLHFVGQAPTSGGSVPALGVTKTRNARPPAPIVASALPATIRAVAPNPNTNKPT